MKKWVEELNWQTLLIEEAESKIKSVIKYAVINRENVKTINPKIVKIVNDTISKLENTELKEKVKQSLYSFASSSYIQIKAKLVFVNIAVLGAVITLNSNTSSSKNKMKAITVLQQNEPKLKEIDITDRHYATAQPLKKYMADYMQDVRTAFSELATSSAKDDYSENISLRNIAEMTVRYENKEDDLNRLKSDGVKLVWTSTHGNCSERCEPYQGKLYSLDGTYGEIDGVKYIPLEVATDIYYTTKSGKTYKNGIISGFNCRHFLIPYKKGNAPIHISSEEIKKDREINNTQREFERNIRKAKQLAIGLRDIEPLVAKKHKELAVYLNKKYAEYSKQNNVATYPSRCRVFDGEEILNKQ